MVSHMPNQDVALDRVFRALADPTRRAVLERLGAGPASVSALAEPFAMALPTFAQHLKVLEACGLVRSSKARAVRLTYYILICLLFRAHIGLQTFLHHQDNWIIHSNIFSIQTL